MSSPRFLRLPEVIQKVGLKRSSIYAMEAAGLFPRRLKLGSHSVAWLEEDIDRWIEERVAASHSAVTPIPSLLSKHQRRKSTRTNSDAPFESATVSVGTSNPEHASALTGQR